MWYVDKRLSNLHFMTYILCTADKVISGCLFTFIINKLWEHLLGVFTQLHNTYSNFFFHDYDVTNLKIIYPITFHKTNYTKQPIKVLRNKNNINIQPFYITVPRTPSEYLCTNVFYNINFRSPSRLSGLF